MRPHRLGVAGRHAEVKRPSPRREFVRVSRMGRLQARRVAATATGTSSRDRALLEGARGGGHAFGRLAGPY